MSSQKLGNPAVVGLAGFGLTTLVLQFHNVGWMELGPVIWLGLIFGGIAQLVAGLQEMKTGNNFGYCAFTSYGAFWIALALMFIGTSQGWFAVSAVDVGWFLVAWTGYTAIMWVAAMRVNGAIAWTFTALLIGFILLVIGHFGWPIMNVIAGYELMVCALLAWYVMAHLIFADVFGRDILPVGKPWVVDKPAAPAAAAASSEAPAAAQPAKPAAAAPKLGNPAVVGLAGFGLTTLVLQFHNVGWMDLGPVIWLGLVFGGLAQLIAGLQEMKTGNNFGYSAFTSYGAFWIALALMLIGNSQGWFAVSTTDVGWFLLAWTFYTAIMWVGSMRINSALAWTFTALLGGFILLVIGHFGWPIMNVVAGYELMVCALLAWYVMAHLIFADVFGRDILPVGKPWIRESLVSKAKDAAAAAPKLGNPAVVGLAGFGLTTLVLQFHNVGWMDLGPVIWLGLIFGGLAQLIAGLQEMQTGNNFGYSAFTSYGAFWIALALMFIGSNAGWFAVSTTDVGWFLLAWTLYTAIMWVGSMRINSALAWTFTALLGGFILLDLGHFGWPIMNVVAGYELMICALLAWYVMAHLIFADVFGRDVLPVGKPWLDDRAVRKLLETASTVQIQVQRGAIGHGLAAVGREVVRLRWVAIFVPFLYTSVPQPVEANK